jgi:hypothetical protein
VKIYVPFVLSLEMLKSSKKSLVQEEDRKLFLLIESLESLIYLWEYWTELGDQCLTRCVHSI